MQTTNTSKEVEVEQLDDVTQSNNNNPSNPEKGFWKNFLEKNNLKSNTVYYRLSSKTKNEFSNTSQLMSQDAVSKIIKKNDSRNPASLINILRTKHGFLTQGIDPDSFSKNEDDGKPHYWYDNGKDKYYLLGYKKSDYDVVVMTHNVSIQMISKSDFKNYSKAIIKIISVDPTENEVNKTAHFLNLKEIKKGVKDLSSVLMVIGALSATAIAAHFLEPYVREGTQKAKKFGNYVENKF